MAPQTPSKASPIYRVSRLCHEWLGLGTALLVCLLALTGIYLNHKELFSPAPVVKRQAPAPSPIRLSTRIAPGDIALNQMMERVQQEWDGKVPLEHIQLKQEGKGLVWRLKGQDGRELHLDARDMRVLFKRGILPTSALNKTLHDLHTGEIVGTTGRLIIDLTALSIIILTVSGLIMWAKPRLNRQKRSRTKSAGT